MAVTAELTHSLKRLDSELAAGTRVCSTVQSAYLKRLPLGAKLFAFLVKLRLEGALSVLFASLETL